MTIEPIYQQSHAQDTKKRANDSGKIAWRHLTDEAQRGPVSKTGTYETNNDEERRDVIKREKKIEGKESWSEACIALHDKSFLILVRGIFLYRLDVGKYNLATVVCILDSLHRSNRAIHEWWKSSRLFLGDVGSVAKASEDRLSRSVCWRH